MAYTQKLEVSINLKAIYQSFWYNIQGHSGTVRCLCIPETALQIDNKGKAWLNINAWPEDKFAGQTHSLKQALTREEFAKADLPEINGKKQIPYCGAIKHPKQGQGKNKPAVEESPENAFTPAENIDNGLPF